MIDEEEDEVPECPEASGLRDNYVVSGEFINFEYSVGIFCDGDGHPVCSVISIAECDGAVLCALPEQAWDRVKAKRALPADFLRKGVRVMVAGSIDEDRTAPEAQPSFRIWVGIVKGSYEQYITYDYEDPDFGFPIDDKGFVKLPYARALISVARDHFEFQTADSGGAGGAGGDPALAQRLAALEAELAALRDGAPRGAGRARTQTSQLGAAPKKAAVAPQIPPGLDPALAQQALQSGMSPDALGELSNLMGGVGLRPRAAPPPRGARQAAVDSEEEAEEEDVLSDAAGSQTPVEKAVLQLSKIVTSLSREKKVLADRSLESILDRAESGSGSRDQTLGSTRSKAAALRTLRKLLSTKPELIYQSIEANMEQDWTRCPVRRPRLSPLGDG